MGAPLSAEEKARRSVALTVAETRKAPGLLTIDPFARLCPLDGVIAEAVSNIASPRAEPEPAPRRKRVPDHRVVTVTISGAPSSGKSVIAHLIRNALAYEGVTASGPEGLRSVLWRRGVQDLIARGLTVILEAGETGDA